MIKMHQNSLFAVLLRSPWWVSALVALGLVLVAQELERLRSLSPEQFAGERAQRFARR